MKQADLREMFEPDAPFKPFTRKLCLEKGAFPNVIYFDGRRSIGVLVVERAKNGVDFALSRGGLNYVNVAEDERRIGQGYVVTRDHNGSFLSQDTVKNVLTKLRGIKARTPPPNGNMGPYYWMTDTLEVHASMGAPTATAERVIEYDEAPF